MNSLCEATLSFNIESKYNPYAGKSYIRAALFVSVPVSFLEKESYSRFTGDLSVFSLAWDVPYKMVDISSGERFFYFYSHSLAGSFIARKDEDVFFRNLGVFFPSQGAVGKL